MWELIATVASKLIVYFVEKGKLDAERAGKFLAFLDSIGSRLSVSPRLAKAYQDQRARLRARRQKASDEQPKAH